MAFSGVQTPTLAISDSLFVSTPPLNTRYPPNPRINARACSSVNPCLAIVRLTMYALRSPGSDLWLAAPFFWIISDMVRSFGFGDVVPHWDSIFLSVMRCPPVLVVAVYTHFSHGIP